MEKNHRKPNRKKLELIKRELAEYDAVVITGASSGIGRGIVELIDEVSHVRLCNISRSFPSFLSDRKDFLHVPCDLKNSGGNFRRYSQNFRVHRRGTERESAEDSACQQFGIRRVRRISRTVGFEKLRNGRCERPRRRHALRRICRRDTRGARLYNKYRKHRGVSGVPAACGLRGDKVFRQKLHARNLPRTAQTRLQSLCVCPGPTSSNFFRAAGFDTPPLPSGFGHEPRDVAEAALEALARGKILKVVGRTNFLQCAATRFVPTALLVKISGFVLERIRSLK